MEGGFLIYILAEGIPLPAVGVRLFPRDFSFNHCRFKSGILF